MSQINEEKRAWWAASECCGATMIEAQNMCGACKEYALSRSAAADRDAARVEWEAKKREQEECPHDEHDHGICLDCGLDIFDDLVGAAEFAADCREDR